MTPTIIADEPMSLVSDELKKIKEIQLQFASVCSKIHGLSEIKAVCESMQRYVIL